MYIHLQADMNRYQHALRSTSRSYCGFFLSVRGTLVQSISQHGLTNGFFQPNYCVKKLTKRYIKILDLFVLHMSQQMVITEVLRRYQANFIINLFQPSVPFLYPLKTSENKKLSFVLSVILLQAGINPFVSNATFLYPLKTSENRKVQRKGALGTNGLTHINIYFGARVNLQETWYGTAVSSIN